MGEENKMKNRALELLRGISAFGIVACHLNLSAMTSAGWNVRALADMNVGLFAALSGFLMWKNNRNDSWVGYAKKRCVRLLPTYFVWTIGYVIFGFCFDLLVRHGINPKWYSISYIPSVLFKGNSACHLWFLIALLYSQLFFYVIAKYVKGWFAIGVSFVGIIVIGYYHDNWYTYYLLRLFVFLVGGYGIRSLLEEKVESNLQKSMIWFIIVAIGIIAHYGFSKTIPTFIRDWLVAIPLLIAFVYMPIRSERVGQIAEWLGATSMGVFLIHPVITAANNIWMPKAFSAPFGAMAVLIDWVVSWMIAFIIASIAIRVSWLKRWWS